MKVTWANFGLQVYPENKEELVALRGIVEALRSLPFYIDQRIEREGIVPYLGDEQPIGLTEEHPELRS